MNRNSVFLGWTIGGAGVILLYSAYKNRSPVAVITSVLNGESLSNTSPITGTVTVNSGAPTNNFSNTSSVSSRAAQLKAGTIKPNLVSIGSQPRFQLDSEAASSFARVEAAYGQTIKLTGSYRTYAEQAAAYALDPSRFAPPGQSLHELGLAVDVDTSMNLDDPALVAAFTNNGWYRQGKTVVYNGTSRAEPWHWSYGVPG